MIRDPSPEVSVDCAEGRRMGCHTFCCRLIVRLDEDERDHSVAGTPKSCVDKDAEGYCVHVDRETGWCRNWEARPRLCRRYDCNSDPMLQVVLRDGFTSLVRMVTAPLPPRETWKKVPLRSS